NHAKKDSQGVCFIGPLDMKEFLVSYIKPKPGKVIHTDGRVLGSHDGVYYYTIGQRHGLNITDGGGPYYVTAKDLKKNIIFVGENIDTTVEKAKVAHFNWVSSIKLPQRVDVKVRYRARSVKAILSKNGELKFSKPERAVTSGQSAVFYKGRQLLGGGIIV
ncbi:tRNA 2-thiouridine(34) synthase MnmA, partial [Candidatus Parcubacteria bacterium]|nr:tRNA 2-thiouridine(34) synthase MnmA [Candidatus Parcubacteria bacterium]